MRFIALDQTRGLAITAMVLAHFGPGLYSRIGLEGLVLDALLLFGRFATPTFIAIFGLTLAFAYFPKAANDPAKVRGKLIRRSGTVMLAAFTVSLPEFVETLATGSYWGGKLSLGLLIAFYGVLTFYTLAIFSAGLLIRPLSRAPNMVPVVLGSVMVFAGSFLGYNAWPPTEPGLLEYLRLTLVAGKYAYLSNFGVVLILGTVGYNIRQMQKNGESLTWPLLTIGIAVLLCGLAMGRVSGWRTLADLHTNYAAPPQVWYLGMVIGGMFLAIAFFDRFRIPIVSFVMEHTGRNPLSIYIAQAFVLPAVEVLRAGLPRLPDAIHILAPIIGFLIYWAYVIYRSSRT